MESTYKVVVQWIVNGHISFHGDGDSHENRSCHHNHLSRKEEVGEEEGVDPGDEVEAFAETLQNGAEKVAGVEKGQGNQEEVEGVPHLLGGQDEAGDEVDEDADDGKGGLDHALQPKAQLVEQVVAAFVVLWTPDVAQVFPEFEADVGHQTIVQFDDGRLADTAARVHFSPPRSCLSLFKSRRRRRCFY